MVSNYCRNKFRIYNNKRTLKFVLIFSIFLGNLVLITFAIPNNKVKNKMGLSFKNEEIKAASGNSILFQGTEDALNITDYGNLYNNSSNYHLLSIQAYILSIKDF